MEKTKDLLTTIRENCKRFYAQFLPAPYVRGSVRPKYDWAVLMVVMASFFCLSAGVALYLYVQVNNGAIFSVPNDENKKSVSVNSNLFQEVLRNINDKELKFNSLSNNPSTVPDPSK